MRTEQRLLHLTPPGAHRKQWEFAKALTTLFILRVSETHNTLVYTTHHNAYKEICNVFESYLWFCLQRHPYFFACDCLCCCECERNRRKALRGKILPLGCWIVHLAIWQLWHFLFLITKVKVCSWVVLCKAKALVNTRHFSILEWIPVWCAVLLLSYFAPSEPLRKNAVELC